MEAVAPSVKLANMDSPGAGPVVRLAKRARSLMVAVIPQKSVMVSVVLQTNAVNVRANVHVLYSSLI